MCAQIQATGSWSSAGTQTAAMLEIKQPFTSTLSHLQLQVLSHHHAQGNGRNNQVHLLHTYTHRLIFTETLDEKCIILSIGPSVLGPRDTHERLCDRE